MDAGIKKEEMGFLEMGHIGGSSGVSHHPDRLTCWWSYNQRKDLSSIVWAQIILESLLHTEKPKPEVKMFYCPQHPPHSSPHPTKL